MKKFMLISGIVLSSIAVTSFGKMAETERGMGLFGAFIGFLLMAGGGVLLIVFGAKKKKK